jgi:hypothetical protein
VRERQETGWSPAKNRHAHERAGNTRRQHGGSGIRPALGRLCPRRLSPSAHRKCLIHNSLWCLQLATASSVAETADPDVADDETSTRLRRATTKVLSSGHPLKIRFFPQSTQQAFVAQELTRPLEIAYICRVEGQPSETHTCPPVTASAQRQPHPPGDMTVPHLCPFTPARPLYPPARLPSRPHPQEKNPPTPSLFSESGGQPGPISP